MLDTLKSLLEDQIKDLYNAENQLVKALPKMAKKASLESLRQAFEAHLEETRGHVQRLESAANILEIKPGGKTCKAMQGLVEEGKEAIEEEGDEHVLDAALIAAAQRVEHYEIAAYGTARALAEQLGERKIIELLEETLAEEKAADKTLTNISEDEVFPAAGQAAGQEDTGQTRSSPRRPSRESTGANSRHTSERKRSS